MRLGAPQAAQEAFQAAVKLEVDRASHHVGLAKAYTASGDVDLAQSAYEAALSHNPADVASHVGLAVIAEKKNDRERAIFHRRSAVALRPDHPSWHAALGRQLILAGETNAAIQSYKSALEISPENSGWRAILNEMETWADHGDWTQHDATAGYYDAIYSSSDKYGASAEDSAYTPIWKRIRELLLQNDRLKVLDVGCGPGQCATILCKESDILYHGFDFSKVAIESAKAKQIPNASFSFEDARTTERFKQHDYDAIISTEVLEHVRDDLGLFRQFAKGTFCLCSVPSYYSFSHLRYFADHEQVLERYQKMFERCTVESFNMSSAGNKIFLFYGLLRSC